jgi:hypothetical protein
MDPRAERRTCSRAATSSSARPAACATTWSAARSTFRRSGRRARRGRRDARHGLPRRPRGDPRLHAHQPPHAAVLRHHRQGRSRRSPAATSARPSASTPCAATRRTATSSTGAIRVAPNEIEHASSTCCATSRRLAPRLLRHPRARSATCTARFASGASPAVALSGEMTQKERTDALQALRDGHARACVATDVAAARPRPSGPWPGRSTPSCR